MSQLSNKQNLQDTAQSFCPLRPQQLNQHNHQAFSQIQQMNALLAQKKSKLRDLKWESHSLKQKYQQQDRRIMQVKSTMDFQIQKEELQVNNNTKYKDLQNFMEEDIKKLQADIQYLKDQLTMYYDDIMNTKKEKQYLVKEHYSLESKISEMEQNTRTLQTQLVDKDNVIVEIQGVYREKQDQFTKLQIEFTDLESLDASLSKKNILGKKQLHAQSCKTRQLLGEIQNNQDKSINLKKQLKETTWQYQKVEVYNQEIQEVNNKLKCDLQAVQKHLASIRKTNQILRSSLQEYCTTAFKVAKLVTFDQFNKCA